MRAVYYVLAEARVGERWVSLNPVFRAADGALRASPVCCFRNSDAYNAISYWANAWGIPDDCSEDVLQIFEGWLYEDDARPQALGEKAWWKAFDQYVDVVYYARSVKALIKSTRPYKYMYYVPRACVAAFECGEIREIQDWVTKDEYLKFSEDMKRAYVYFEWNEPYDAYTAYCRIVNLVDAQIALFNDVCGTDRLGYGGEVFPEDVRLIIRRYYC